MKVSKKYTLPDDDENLSYGRSTAPRYVRFNICFSTVRLQLRTRTSLLHSLCEELKDKTKEFLGYSSDGGASGLGPELQPKSAGSSSSSSECGNGGTISGAGSRFIDTVRKALSARVKNQTLFNAEANNNNSSGGLSKKTSSCSADGIPSVSINIKIQNEQMNKKQKPHHPTYVLQFGRSLSKNSKKSSPSSPISSPDIHPVHRTSR